MKEERRRASSPVGQVVIAILVLALYLALGFVIFRHAWRQPEITTIGSTGDTRLFAWFFGWAQFALAHGHNPFYSNYIDWPLGINLMWNTSILLPAAILAPVTGALGPVFAYNLLVTLSPGLSAFAAYLLIRRFVAGQLPAVIGALVYGFSPFIIAESLGHPMITVAPLPPLIFLLIDDLVRRRRPLVLTGILLGVLAAAQLLISEELLATTAIVAVIVLVLAAALYPDELRPTLPHVLRGGAIGLATFLVLAAYPLAVQFLGRQRLGVALHPPNLFVNDLLGFVVPNRFQLLAPRAAVALSDRFIGGHPLENGAYLGVPLLLLLGFVTIRYWSDPRVRLAALSATVIAILSLGYTLHIANKTSLVPVLVLALAFPLLGRFLPGLVLMYLTAAGWLALDRLPVIKQLLPSRLSIFIYLFVGLLIALLLERVPAMTGWRKPAAVAATVIALVPLVPATSLLYRSATVPAFFSGAGVTAIPQGAIVLVVPYAGLHHEEPMLWQAVARLRYRMPEGYAFTPDPDVNPVNAPPTFTRNLLWAIEAGAHDGSLSADEQSAVEADLDRWQVRYVIVGPMSHEDQAIAAFTALFSRPPSETDGIDLWTR